MSIFSPELYIFMHIGRHFICAEPFQAANILLEQKLLGLSVFLGEKFERKGDRIRDLGEIGLTGGRV